MTEYLIITMAMIVAISVPYGTDSKSAVERMVEAMRQEHSAYLYAVSLTPLPDVCCD